MGAGAPRVSEPQRDVVAADDRRTSPTATSARQELVSSRRTITALQPLMRL